jgi:NADPH-ferrihemoprotein reductase
MLDTTDLVILILVTLGTIAYFTKGKLWAKPVQVGYGYGSGKATANGVAKPKKTRNIVERMEQQNKNVVVFFGSQTGTAGMSPLCTKSVRNPQSFSQLANLFFFL